MYQERNAVNESICCLSKVNVQMSRSVIVESPIKRPYTKVPSVYRNDGDSSCLIF